MQIVGALLIGGGLLLLVYYLRLFDAWVDRHMNRPAKGAAGIALIIAHH